MDSGICLCHTNEPLVLLLPDDHSRRQECAPMRKDWTLMCRCRLQYSRDGHSADHHEVFFNGNGYVTLDARVNFNSDYFKKCLEYTLQKNFRKRLGEVSGTRPSFIITNLRLRKLDKGSLSGASTNHHPLHASSPIVSISLKRSIH